MPLVCRKTLRVSTLYVVVESSDGTAAVCTLGRRTDVRHRVTVKNYGGYPADLKCVGRIGSNPRAVEFSPVQFTDTASHWDGAFAALPDLASTTLGNVPLLPAGAGVPGPETVLADLQTTWPQPARSRTDTLDIQVSP
jgi:hypothetical protein